MAITYHAGRRIQGLSTDVADTPTFEDDFSGADNWTDTGSGWGVNTTTDVIDFNADSPHNVTEGLYYDLGSALSSVFTIRFKLTIANFNVGSSSIENHLYFGVSDSTSHVRTQTQDIIGIHSTHWTGGNADWKTMTANNAALPGTRDYTFTHALQAETLYVQIKSLSSSQFQVDLYSDSGYSTLIESSGAQSHSATGLRYLKFQQRDNAPSGDNHTLNGTIDDVEVYDGATTNKPTNVQLGSRFEETDTRKMYNLSNMSTSGLKAYYNFDSIDSSTTLTNQATTGDGLGSSADGTVTNATLDTTNEKLGTGCYNFDGNGDKVVLGSATTSLDFLTTGSNDWSVSFWLKLNGTEPDGNNAILCQGQGNEAGLDILFDVRSAESRDHVLGVRLEGNSGNTAMKLYTSAQFIPKDTDWHHYVITGDVSTRTVTAYRDGGNAESDSTGSGSFPTTLAQKPTFGVHPTSSFSGADLNAKLDDCSLWSRILTSDEISLLYNSGTGATPYTTKTWQEIGA